MSVGKSLNDAADVFERIGVVDIFGEDLKRLSGNIERVGGFVVEFEPEYIFGVGDGEPAIFAAGADVAAADKRQCAQQYAKILMNAEAGADGDGVGHEEFVFEQAQSAGDIDDFALWNRGMSIDELREIYNAGRQNHDLRTLLKEK